MTALTAQAVLQAWESAQGEHPLRRPQALLCAAWPEVDAGAWGRMPLGARDAQLARLHERLFGPELDTVADCPRCHERLQTGFSTVDLGTPGDAADAREAAAERLHCEGFDLVFRLPASDDLLALAETPDSAPESALRWLLERCLIEARRAGEPASAAELPATVVQQVQREMALRDPGADTSVALTCPACGHGFERRFDMGAYLWDAVDDWAQRTLGEVHLLACAYGWSEPQILALSAARRSHYIALVTA